MVRRLVPLLLGIAAVACSQPGEAPQPLDAKLDTLKEVQTCRGESIDLSPDGRWLVVTCRGRETVIVDADPASSKYMTVAAKIEGAGAGEGVRFHPSGDFALFSTHREGICPDGQPLPNCTEPFDSEVVLVALPQAGKGAPHVAARWKMSEGDQTCLAGEDVAVSPDGTIAAAICNRPGRVFLFDTDPASATFGKARIGELPSKPDRQSWLDEVEITGAGQVLVSDIDLSMSGKGLIRSLDAASGREGAPVWTAPTVAGLHLDPTGRWLYASVWDHGAARIDLKGKPDDAAARTILRYGEKAMSYDLTTAPAADGAWAFAVTQYPGRLDVYDFEGKRSTSRAIPSKTANMPTSTVVSPDRSRVYVQVETGSLYAIATGAPAPKARIARFGLKDPCAKATVLEWSVEGASAVSITGAGTVDASGSRPVEATKTTRYVLEATYPDGVARAVAVHWQPGAALTEAICGKPAPPPSPADAVIEGQPAAPAGGEAPAKP
jgi:hypothetical protein